MVVVYLKKSPFTNIEVKERFYSEDPQKITQGGSSFTFGYIILASAIIGAVLIVTNTVSILFFRSSFCLSILVSRSKTFF